jgi:DNA-directed RNA polymerase specialized sigma24 family protein
MVNTRKNSIDWHQSMQIQKHYFIPAPKHLTSTEVKELIDKAMETLKEERPEDYALLYELYFNRLSLHSLSRTLKIPRSTLRYRKNKALKHIKQLITKEVDEK